MKVFQLLPTITCPRIWIRPKFVRRPVSDRPALHSRSSRCSQSQVLKRVTVVHSFIPVRFIHDAAEKDRKARRQGCRSSCCSQRPGDGTGPIAGCYPRGFIQQAIRCPLCRQAESESHIRSTSWCSCIALVVLVANVGCSAARMDVGELESVEYHRSHHLLHRSC